MSVIYIFSPRLPLRTRMKTIRVLERVRVENSVTNRVSVNVGRDIPNRICHDQIGSHGKVGSLSSSTKSLFQMEVGNDKASKSRIMAWDSRHIFGSNKEREITTSLAESEMNKNGEYASS